MNFGLVVLTIHKYIQKLLSCFKTKYLSQIAIFIIKIVVNIFYSQIMNYIESIYNFRDCYTNIPYNFWSALLLTL